ncbi:uncharacterized protein LOC133297550 [Gastrolobium bilobum]|uniref:uncharacterized protein LOC133297550 n=1 Tax=Gastrolobium bilobum TaxID=150636 RepID=UPI002AB18EE2|nr:uncharacterized protein LOC133297550 [Gastrolobium bilobum]
MGDRTLKQLAAPNVDNEQPLCIRYTNPVVPFELKSGLIHLLPKFHGLAGEDPHKYLKEFHIVCSTMKPTGVDEEQIKLRAFPFSLDSGAKDWLYYLPPSSIVSWNDMARLFLEKFFPSSRATSIRKEISGIRQANGENMHEYWERFKRLCSSCPHHQIPDNLLLVYFYKGLLPMDRNLLDAASGGVLSNKTPNEAKELIAEIAANAQQFGTRANSSAVFQVQTPPMQNPTVAATGASSTDNQRMENRLDELTSMVRQLAVTQTVQPSAQQISNLCGICCDPSHPTDACPSFHQDNDFQDDQSVAAIFPGKPQYQQQQQQQYQQQQNNPFSNTYNPGWKNHPNLRWNQNHGPSLEDLMKQMATSNLQFQQQMEEPTHTAAETSNGGDTSSKKQSTDTSDVHIPLSFPQRATQSKKQSAKVQDKEILDTFRKVEVNIPLLDAIQQIPRYAKFLKELCTNKRRLKGDEQVNLSQNVSALIQPMPKKCQDPGTFTIPCVIGNSVFHDCMLDLGASINVMPASVFKSLGLGPLRATGIVVTLANRSSIHPSGLIEDVLVRINNLIFPADFYILEMESETATNRSPIILGRPFMRTARTKIDVHSGTLSMEFGDSIVHFNIFDAMKHPREEHSVFCVDVIDDVVEDISATFLAEFSTDFDSDFCGCGDSRECIVCDEITSHLSGFNDALIDDSDYECESNEQLPVIVAKNLLPEQEDKLLTLLKENKRAIGWTMADIIGISPSTCMHRILLEEGAKPVRQPQRRLNPLILDMVKKEVTKLLQAGMIYPISDSQWVSPVQVVPKKSGVTVIANQNNELITTRAQNSWRVCIDYRRLNQATRKDHYPLPFIDQMLERLAGKSHYCFLDGYSGYFQIHIAPEDQEKTTFTCPFGTYAYRRMPFGLCNAPGTFQRCRVVITTKVVVVSDSGGGYDDGGGGDDSNGCNVNDGSDGGGSGGGGNDDCGMVILESVTLVLSFLNITIFMLQVQDFT